MEDTSWEWYYYATNPSPMENVQIWCKICSRVMGYHGMEFKEATAEDWRKGGTFSFITICPDCAEDLPDDGEDE